MIDITHTSVQNILTRTSGYLSRVSSHSLQPYRGCSYGNSLCGVGCYVQHNRFITRGREWGSFLEIRDNAAESYLQNFDRESRWARNEQGEFSIFCSSSTDPFIPQEKQHRVTMRLLEAMISQPPDLLILQTHSHLVLDVLPQLTRLNQYCRLRVHVSIETDREKFPGLPPHASPVSGRFDACRQLKEAGISVVVTVAPLLPIANPDTFFATIAQVADAVVIDHFIGGDGSVSGTRTRKTGLPEAMELVEPRSTSLTYRDEIVRCAMRSLPGCVGVHIDGFAGRYLPPADPSVHG